MLLLLIRHAVTPMTGKRLSGWMKGISLSKDGVAQAEALAARLQDVPVTHLYSSPLERCRETAKLIAKSHRLSVEVMDDVGEIRYGKWEGRTMASLYKSKAWKDLKARPADFRFPEGETVREAQVRGMRAIENLRAKHQNKIVAVCSHADLIRVLVAGYIGLPLDLYDRISVGPATVTALYLGQTTPRLLRLSDSGSIDDIIPRAKA